MLQVPSNFFSTVLIPIIFLFSKSGFFILLFVISAITLPLYPESSFPLTSGREMSHPGKFRFEALHEKIGLSIELRMPTFQMHNQQTPWYFTFGQLYCLSNQSNWSCDEIFESRDSRLHLRASLKHGDKWKHAQSIENRPPLCSQTDRVFAL